MGFFKHITPTEFKNIGKSKAINIPPLSGLVQSSLRLMQMRTGGKARKVKCFFSWRSLPVADRFAARAFN